MESLQIKNSEDLKKLIDLKKDQIQSMTQVVIDVEMGLFELTLCTASLGVKHLEKANMDVANFKKEIWNKAKRNGKSNLEEYKKLINFI